MLLSSGMHMLNSDPTGIVAAASVKLIRLVYLTWRDSSLSDTVWASVATPVLDCLNEARAILYFYSNRKTFDTCTQMEKSFETS